MLPTFVIGVREGLEAALIVGIVAAFLRKQGRRELLRWVFVGVSTAVLLCVAVGVALEAFSKTLPQRQQEGLETVIGALAVGMVTYMVVWMRRHSRELKGQLEGLAAGRDPGGSSRAGRAMVAMAFLAVLREGFETVVFLLAAFNESGSGSAAGIGAALGIVVAVALGFGIYRGGVRLNLSKFFRATGLVLVFVAAGLVVNALHTAHEAGWLNIGQGGTVDLTWLVAPGSVRASLLTGLLGVQEHPVVIEVIGWLVYLIPVGIYVAPGRQADRPAHRLARCARRRGHARRDRHRGLRRPHPVAACAAAGDYRRRDHRAADLGRWQLGRGAHPATEPGEQDGRGTARLRRHAQRSPVAWRAAGRRLHRDSAGHRRGETDADADTAQIAELNGGRLPIGVRATSGSVAVRYTDTATLTVWVEPRTRQVLDVRWQETIRASIDDAVIGVVAIAEPVRTATAALPSRAVDAAVTSARSAQSRLDRHGSFRAAAWSTGAIAVLAVLAGVGLFVGARRRPRQAVPTLRSDRAMAQS